MSTPTAGCPHDRARGESRHALLVAERRRDRRGLGRAVHLQQLRRREGACAPGAASRSRRATRRGRSPCRLTASRGRASCSSLSAASIVGHQQRAGHAVALDEVERDRRVERRQHDLTSPCPHGREHGDRSRGVEQRRGDEPAHVGPERVEGLIVQRVGDQVAVGEHHALRRSRRAACVEEARDRGVGQVVGEVGGLGLGQHLLVTVLEIDDVLDARRQAVDHAVREQHARLRIRERVVQLRIGMALVERHERHRASGHRLVQLDVAMAVRAHDADAIPRLHPERAKRSEEATAALPRLGVGELDVAARDRGLVGGNLGRSPQRPDHRRHARTVPES